jgi:hypothetical protein
MLISYAGVCAATLTCLLDVIEAILPMILCIVLWPICDMFSYV